MAGRAPRHDFNHFLPFNRFHEMKAIYLNLDPYLQAVADWLNAGHPGPKPHFDPLPLAVTIPLGESAVVYVQRNFADIVDGADDYSADTVTIDGQSVSVFCKLPSESAPSITHNVVLGFSSIAPSAKYSSLAIAGDTSVEVYFLDENDEPYLACTIPVLVRRETASGPVDLVDFTPPAAAPSAAQINAALGGRGAQEGKPLAGVRLNGTEWLKEGATVTSSVYITTPDPSSVTGGSDVLAVTSPGS